MVAGGLAEEEEEEMVVATEGVEEVVPEGECSSKRSHTPRKSTPPSRGPARGGEGVRFGHEG